MYPDHVGDIGRYVRLYSASLGYWRVPHVAGQGTYTVHVDLRLPTLSSIAVERASELTSSGLDE